MAHPPLNFITLHYAYIIFMGLLSFPILLPEGNLKAIDAYFFGASASTESGLNTVDVKDLKLYQQLYIYFIPSLTNLGFINIIVVVVRLLWFRKHLKVKGPSILNHAQSGSHDGPAETDLELGRGDYTSEDQPALDGVLAATSYNLNTESAPQPQAHNQLPDGGGDEFETLDEAGRLDRAATAAGDDVDDAPAKGSGEAARIKFAPSTDHRPRSNATLYVPGPSARDQGQPLVELPHTDKENEIDAQSIEDDAAPSNTSFKALRRRRTTGLRISESRSIDRAAGVASSVFILGSDVRARVSTLSRTGERAAADDMLSLSRSATIGRNSAFRNLTEQDRERLGGIEYRSLKLLLKIVLCYFFGIQLFGAIGTIGWIQYADPKYKEYLQGIGLNMNWWAFYSSQTMVNNLGFTLTPDSMITFQDAVWPMLLWSFLAFAGNTLYPVFLRLVIWAMSKSVAKNASVREPLSFLLNHPRRCYTLLFPSRPTWVLFLIIFVLNFVDILLILILDLHNLEVAALPGGKRVAAAIFQAASTRHTGTSSFNLANVNPAVQFSLLVMMYISIFPIAISIRASNTYEERAVGVYPRAGNPNESEGDGKSYILSHMRNQLSFDLWYIFLGTFLICIAEADRIADAKDPAIQVFPILFEATSAYANVGLSLGYPTVSTSLTGELSTFSKVIVCLLMIRGRHRGLPNAIDRAIMLPDEQLVDGAATSDEGE